MSAAANPFSRATVIVVVLVGFAAFIGLLFFLGAGGAFSSGRDGNAHGASNSLVGYKALVGLLERTGYDVRLSRAADGFATPGLLVMTPSGGVDIADIQETVKNRMFVGPTLIILPKWLVGPAQEEKTGWVHLQGPLFAQESRLVLDRFVEEQRKAEVENPELAIASTGQTGSLQSLFTGEMAAPKNLVTVRGDGLYPVIRAGDNGGAAAVVLDNGGYFPELDLSAPDSLPSGADTDLYPVVFVVEPDLFNNMGLASKARAAAALDMIANMAQYSEGNVVFDVTLNGLGATDNLLTLAFRPPFLSATICLILAALAAAWMAFNRFGPPFVEARAIDFGKTALVRNSAGFIRRMNREHLLTTPYVEQVRREAATALGFPGGISPQETEERLDRIGEHEGKTFSALASDLRSATKRHDIARKAQALQAWKREHIG